MDANRISDAEYLLTHFKKIGVTAQMLKKEDQDPTRHKRFLGIGQPAYKFKMENRKCDYLELNSTDRLSDKIYYYTCVYIVEFEVGDFPGKFEALYQEIQRGLFSSNIRGFEWIVNSRLSKELSRDATLRDMLLDTSITNISVTPQVNHVDIEVVYHSHWPERWDYGTILVYALRDLVVFEKIAGFIREVAHLLKD